MITSRIFSLYMYIYPYVHEPAYMWAPVYMHVVASSLLLCPSLMATLYIFTQVSALGIEIYLLIGLSDEETLRNLLSLFLGDTEGLYPTSGYFSWVSAGSQPGLYSSGENSSLTEISSHFPLRTFFKNYICTCTFNLFSFHMDYIFYRFLDLDVLIILSFLTYR